MSEGLQLPRTKVMHGDPVIDDRDYFEQIRWVEALRAKWIWSEFRRRQSFC